MINPNFDRPWLGVIQEWKCYPMLGSNLPSDDYLGNVVKLIPVLVLFNQVSMQGLKFRPSWECNIKSLRCEEGLFVKEIEVVRVI